MTAGITIMINNSATNGAVRKVWRTVVSVRGAIDREGSLIRQHRHLYAQVRELLLKRRCNERRQGTMQIVNGAGVTYEIAVHMIKYLLCR